MAGEVIGRILNVGPVKGKARPRLSVRVDETEAQLRVRARERVRGAVRTRTHTPWETKAAEERWQALWMAQGRPRVPDGEPFALEVRVYVARPASHWKKNGELTAAGLRAGLVVPRSKKPDLDNVVKLILDALNGFAWRDDAQLAELLVRRVWCASEAVEVVVSTVDPDGG